ncbi:MAG TPA: aminotransferase class V-fold PLP-dependent enzyme, partial [Longimicrobiales bacterium]
MTTSRRNFIAQLTAAAVAGSPLRFAHARPRAQAIDWHELRDEFLVPRDVAYFNAATLGAQPRVVLQTVIDHMVHVERDLAMWDYKPEHEQFYAGYYPELSVRRKLAAFVNADVDEIALTENATSGMNIIANGLDLRVGDEVIMLDKGHIGSRSGWEVKDKRCGIYVKQVKLPDQPTDMQQLFDLYDRATTSKTRVWVIEHLTSACAIPFPVNELCARARERGIMTVVDGAQSCGHLPVDVAAMGCDAFYTSASKWMMAPRGISFMYVNRQVLPELWTTLASEHWDDHENGAFRLMQRGSCNGSLVRGLEAANDIYNEIGFGSEHARIVELSGLLRSQLSELDHVNIVSPRAKELWSGTVTFEVRGFTGVQLQDALWEHGRVRVRRQGNAVRQCCHVWNLEKEIARTV